ncbi:beta-adaptin-like protein B [Tanacetum coccineum]
MGMAPRNSTILLNTKDKRRNGVKKVIVALELSERIQPYLAILAVNTFVKDTQDPNPLICALAVRTMRCIRVDKITEYLCDPLQRCLKVCIVYDKVIQLYASHPKGTLKLVKQ